MFVTFCGVAVSLRVFLLKWTTCPLKGLDTLKRLFVVLGGTRSKHCHVGLVIPSHNCLAYVKASCLRLASPETKCCMPSKTQYCCFGLFKWLERDMDLGVYFEDHARFPCGKKRYRRHFLLVHPIRNLIKTQKRQIKICPPALTWPLAPCAGRGAAPRFASHLPPGGNWKCWPWDLVLIFLKGRITQNCLP